MALYASADTESAGMVSCFAEFDTDLLEESCRINIPFCFKMQGQNGIYCNFDA